MTPATSKQHQSQALEIHQHEAFFLNRRLRFLASIFIKYSLYISRTYFKPDNSKSHPINHLKVACDLILPFATMLAL